MGTATAHPNPWQETNQLTDGDQHVKRGGEAIEPTNVKRGGEAIEPTNVKRGGEAIDGQSPLYCQHTTG